MKFKEYLEGLNKMVETRPELLDLEVVYATDDEGNSFSAVRQSPTIGRFRDGDEFMESTSEDWDESDKINAVCIN